MKRSVQKQLVWLVAVGVAAVLGEHPCEAQRRSPAAAYRAAQNVPTPAVDLPTPATEADPFPSLNEIVPPSLEGSRSRMGSPAFNQSGLPGGDPPAVYDESVMDGTQFDDFAPYDDARPGPEFSDVESAFVQDPCCDDPAPIYSTGSWFRRGRWYTQMDFVVMTRNDTREIGVALDPSVQGYNNTDLVTQRYKPATRLTIGKFLGRDTSLRDHTIEFSFLGLLDWNGDRILISRQGGTLDTLLTNANASDAATAPFFNADRQTYSVDTSFNNFEANYRILTRPGRDQLALQPNGVWVRHGNASRLRSVLAGMRAIAFDDGVQYTSDYSASTIVAQQVDFNDGLTNTTTTTMTDPITDPTNGRYVVRTHNDMFGVHIGGELVEKYDEWSWGLRGKAGSLLNFADRLSALRSVNVENNVDTVAEQRTDAAGNPLFNDGMGNATTDPTRPDPNDPTMTIDNTPIIDTTVTTTNSGVLTSMFETVKDEQLLFVGEAGMFLTYQLRPNLQVRAAYDFIIMTGLALAPENILFENGFGEFNVQGSTLLHGGSLGFEATW